MIQQKAIDAIYKKYKNRPESPDELDIPLLFEKLPDEAGIQIDGDYIILGSTNPASPFHRILVKHIHAIIEFDEAVAIVLHSAIIFISKDDGVAHVHLKALKQGMLDRFRTILSGQAILL